VAIRHSDAVVHRLCRHRSISTFRRQLIYAGTLALGIPIYRLFRSRGWVSIWHAIVAGGFGGCLLWFVFNLLFSLSLGAGLSDRSTVYQDVLPGGVAGAVFGLVFWMIARPDRTAV
jgi:hypothetical protein